MALLGAIVISGQTMAQDDCISKGKQMFGSKKYKQAVMVLRKCDDSPEARKLLGLAFFELNYMEDAKTYLKKAIENDPDNISLKIKYADAFARNRQFRKGKEEFQKLAEDYPNNLEVKRGLARVSGWNRDYDEAIALYKEILKKDPEDYLSWVQLGVMTSWDKRFAQSVKVFNNILAANPPEDIEIGARLHMAEVLSWMKDFEKAVSEYEKVIEMAPKNPEPYLGKGQVLEWQGKYKKAIKAYEDALQGSPGNKEAKARLQQLMWVK